MLNFVKNICIVVEHFAYIKCILHILKVFYFKIMIKREKIILKIL